MISLVLFAFALFAAVANTQFPVPPTYATTLQSAINSNITISYNRPNASTCATAFVHQKQYAGYVNLPPFTLAPYQQNYSINTFFWFFESRASPETAPLTIWLSGGPGSSSMIGLFEEIGPCEIVQLPNGSYSTQPRLWGWDRSSNLLFIDQPTQTGFSYDERVNATVDLSQDYPSMLENRMEPGPLAPDTPAWRVLNGTFASGRDVNTQDSTAIAARACWHFLQGFLSAFPQYNPGTRSNRTTIEPAGVNLFAESYGGIYGPTFADYFEDQNDRRTSGALPNSTLEIQLDSVGIINGAVDFLTEMISIANFTHNNTYGINTIDLLTYQNTISELNSETGCRGMVAKCRSRTEVFDPDGVGIDEATNNICATALDACSKVANDIYKQVNRSPYDIRVKPEVSLSAAYQEYLTTAPVMQAIGAQVNYTQSSIAVLNAFAQNGDSVRGTQLKSLADLLARGIRVAFIYGDACVSSHHTNTGHESFTDFHTSDIICNWLSGQSTSLALSALLPPYATSFTAASYASIVVNTSYVGGHVRQFGNLSFSRIFNAGHLVPMYQPETAFTVFTRVIKGVDISMGKTVDLATYGTEGVSNSSVYRNEVGDDEGAEGVCWIRDVEGTCTPDERRGIEKGDGDVRNGIWKMEHDGGGRDGSSAKPSKTAQKTQTVAATSSVPLTGVYVATGTPVVSAKAKSDAVRIGSAAWRGAGTLLLTSLLILG
jgi:carboxypeptidase C (cathepsin A)